MELSSHDLSKIFKLSTRTLHHYDEIGLLTPSFRLESGRRIYLKKDFIKLFSIVHFKELGFTLEEIKKILNSHERVPKEIFIKQKQVLNKKIQKLKKMSQDLDKIIDNFDSDSCEVITPAANYERVSKIEEFYPKKAAQEFSSLLKQEMGDKAYNITFCDTPENISAAMEYGKQAGEFLNAITKVFKQKKSPQDDLVQKLLNTQFESLKLVNPYVGNKKIYLGVRDFMTQAVLEHTEARVEEKKLFLFLRECMTIFANNNLS